MEIKRCFDARGCPYAVYDIDVEPEGGQVHDALKQEYKQTTVPYVFVKGVSKFGI